MPKRNIILKTAPKRRGSVPRSAVRKAVEFVFGRTTSPAPGKRPARKTTGVVRSRPLASDQKAMEEIHGLIHEISFALSQGKIEEAKKILAEADKIAHNHCG